MQGLAPYWIDPHDPNARFPDVDLALREPDGLLAIGGDLSPQRLLSAYRQGIFPWYNHGQPILWWSPDPRMVLFPDKLRISRSLRKLLRQKRLEVSVDTAFRDVVAACSESRSGSEGTWITDDMKQAYGRLHDLGHAHSVECWQEGRLVGGIYGIALGGVFFGESMFSRVSNASKVAFVYLVQRLEAWGFALLDCQVESAHLRTLGAENISRQRFCAYLEAYADLPGFTGSWKAGIVSGETET